MITLSSAAWINGGLPIILIRTRGLRPCFYPFPISLAPIERSHYHKSRTSLLAVSKLFYACPAIDDLRVHRERSKDRSRWSDHDSENMKSLSSGVFLVRPVKLPFCCPRGTFIRTLEILRDTSKWRSCFSSWTPDISAVFHSPLFGAARYQSAVEHFSPRSMVART